MQIGVQTKRTNLINGLIGRLDHRWLVVGVITCAVVMLLGVSLRTVVSQPEEQIAQPFAGTL